MSHLHFSVSKNNPDYHWPKGPAFQRDRREPVQNEKCLKYSRAPMELANLGMEKHQEALLGCGIGLT